MGGVYIKDQGLSISISFSRKSQTIQNTIYLSSLAIGWTVLLCLVHAQNDTAIIGRGTAQARLIQRRDLYDEYTPLPDCYIIEVLAIVDESVWYHALDYVGGDYEAAEQFIIDFYHSLYVEIDLRYQMFGDMADACACIRVFLSDIYIVKNMDKSWSKRAEITKNGRKLIDGPTALFSCGRLAKKLKDKGARFDLAQCYLKKNIAWDEYSTGDHNPEFQELGFIATACDMYLQKYLVSIVETNGASLSRQAAKALGFGIGAWEDGKVGCSNQDGFIMSTENSYAYNPYVTFNEWSFSECSVRDICKYIEPLHENCLLDNSFTAKEFYDKICQPLPGTVWGVAEQCQIKYGLDSTPCEEYGNEDICMLGVSCSVDGDCTGFVKVFSGTPCGDDKICFKGECVDTTYNDPVCEPDEVDPPQTCDDNNGGCDQVCNELPMIGVMCDCDYGFTLAPDMVSCLDDNECTGNNGGCEQICLNNEGSFSCSCLPGFTTDESSCTDIDECMASPPNCPNCVNAPGSFTCCDDPCDDVECEQICTNNDGTAECSCLPGYTEYGFDCIDIDECMTSPPNCPNCVNAPGSFTCYDDPCTDAGCEQICTNNDGTALCSCLPGYNVYGLDCIDDNECDFVPKVECRNCMNTVGSFTCDTCQSGWVQNGYSCYLFITNELEWNEAETFCNDRQAFLVDVVDSTENDFLNSVAETTYGIHKYWIGLNDIDIEGVLEWTSGLQIYGFEDFAPGETDGGSGEDCVQADTDADCWEFETCSYKNKFICEEKILPS